MKLKLAYFYPKELNLYGDTGNVEIFVYRAKERGFACEVLEISSDNNLSSQLMQDINLVFMGGGPDSGQKQMYEDFLKNKGPFLKEYVENGGVGLFVCGSYQLMGHYYKSADGNTLPGVGIFDLYTQHFGHTFPRCVGNTLGKLSESILSDNVFSSVNVLNDLIVGFENHGGRTFLQNGSSPFAQVIKGFGNNAQDHTEGVHYKNSIGTYFHGPFLSKNAHVADYLLAKSLHVDSLESLDDYLIKSAHSYLVGRFK